MTEEAEPPQPSPDGGPEAPVMPPWVPTMIGVVLVAIAGLAVWTGLRYQTPTVAGNVARTKHQPHPVSGGGPPGEPEPGSSLMFPGEAPNANAPVSGRARAEISGGGTQGITATMRAWARRGLLFHVTPDDAIVYVNGVAIGEARQFAGPTEVYDFPATGSYTVRITAPGYRDQLFVVTAAENAKDELARIDTALVKTP